MEILYKVCCGVDVHKKVLVACLNVSGKRELKSFGTTTKEIHQLCDWLKDSSCEIIAMESTGPYWKPLYNLLESKGIPAIVVNAAHMKALPGRKTDVKDAEWISDLLRHGLLRASFIPDRDQREMRELVRYRKSIIEERAREFNRLQKILEGANIKLSSCVAEINGVSARKLLDELVLGVIHTEEKVKDTVHRTLHGKATEIAEAMNGILTRLQVEMLRMVLSHIDDMTTRIAEIDKVVAEYSQKKERTLQLLDEIPGIGNRCAEVVVAEIGTDMSKFPTHAHLCSWAGLSPGNNMSAGKSYSGRTNKGNVTLKATLVQAAWSAVRVKNSFFHSQYSRISVRRGKKRAIVAVAHSILIAIYHVIKKDTHYQDLGSDYYNKYNRERKIAGHLKKLNQLGWQIPA